MRHKLAIAFALGGLLISSHAGSSFAATQNNNEAGEGSEATALAGAKTTLSQAIAAAEQRTGGKAYEAGVDVRAGKPRIIVETTGPNGVQTVTFDAQNGQMIGTHAGGERD